VILALISLQSCATFSSNPIHPKPVSLQAESGHPNTISGLVQAGDGGPLVGAIVRVQTTSIYTTSDSQGRFVLKAPATEKPLALTAWAAGYFNGGPVPARLGDQEIRIVLQPHSQLDNPAYKWLPTFSEPGEGEDQACAACHLAAGTDSPDNLPVDQWLQDAHATSATNPRFVSMYLGTDLQGNRSPPTRYVSKKDYGPEPLKPDPNLPYYGPGYKLDFPETAGNCAACHLPTSALADPDGTDPTLAVAGSNTDKPTGIPCDFCHKIWSVALDPATGLPHQNMPGAQSYTFRRPGEGHQFFAGPFDDVAPGEDTFAPLQTQSQFCAPCHFGIFWDVPIYNSYGEWLASPYADPQSGRTCQDCHMPPTGAGTFALPQVGGLSRDPDTLHSHRMPGASDVYLLQNALTMTVTYALDGSALHVQVILTNDQTGHHVPTDSPLRHLILLVQVSDASGQPLPLVYGPTLPDWCGPYPDQPNHYGGDPGVAYARVLAEQWTNTSPTAAYWNPTYLVSDNRLAANASDTSRYTFSATPVPPAHLQVRLLYRRAFIQLAEQKGWEVKDILMESIDIVIK
jgi:hypothetical protein